MNPVEEPYWNSYNQKWNCPTCGKVNYGTAYLCDCSAFKAGTIDIKVSGDNMKYAGQLPAIVARLTMLEQKVEEMQKYIDNMRTTFRNI